MLSAGFFSNQAVSIIQNAAEIGVSYRGIALPILICGVILFGPALLVTMCWDASPENNLNNQNQPAGHDEAEFRMVAA